MEELCHWWKCGVIDLWSWISQWDKRRSLIPCGESVPSWKVIFCLRFLRLSVFPRCMDSPQIVVLWREWWGRLKWCATGLDGSVTFFFETTKFKFENWFWITNKTYRIQRLPWLFIWFEHHYYSFHSTGIVGHYKNTHSRSFRDEQYYAPAARSNWRQKGRNFEVKYISLSHSAYITLRIIMPFCKSCHMPFPRKVSLFLFISHPQFSIVLFVIQHQFSNSNFVVSEITTIKKDSPIKALWM